MSASTQRMIREGQHASEVETANGTATGGGGVLDPTSKGRLPRQKDQNENPIHHEPTLHDRPGKFAPIASKTLHMVFYGARAARKDLLRAVNNLARFINRQTIDGLHIFHLSLERSQFDWGRHRGLVPGPLPGCRFRGMPSDVKIHQWMLPMPDRP